MLHVLALSLQEGVAQDAAQDTVMSGEADGRRQRTEKKTELEMEMSSVAKIKEFWTCDLTIGNLAQRCSVVKATQSHPHELHQADST